MSASAVYVLDLKGKVRPGGGSAGPERSGGASLGPACSRGGRAAPLRQVPPAGGFPLGAAEPLSRSPARGDRVACVACSPFQPLREAAAGRGGGNRARGHPPGVINRCRNWG